MIGDLVFVIIVLGLGLGLFCGSKRVSKFVKEKHLQKYARIRPIHAMVKHYYGIKLLVIDYNEVDQERQRKVYNMEIEYKDGLGENIVKDIEVPTERWGKGLPKPGDDFLVFLDEDENDIWLENPRDQNVEGIQGVLQFFGGLFIFGGAALTLQFIMRHIVNG